MSATIVRLRMSQGGPGEFPWLWRCRDVNVCTQDPGAVGCSVRVRRDSDDANGGWASMGKCCLARGMTQKSTPQIGLRCRHATAYVFDGVRKVARGEQRSVEIHNGA